MKTERLMDMLARGAGPAPRAVTQRRLLPAAAAGVLASIGMALALLGLAPGVATVAAVPWLKLTYASAMAVAAGWLAARLSRPVAPIDRPVRGIVGVALVMALLAGMAWSATPETQRVGALFGSTWMVCPWRVLGLSLPALVAGLWALRGLAPTRLRAAGFAVGLLAGALGAFGYSMACPEPSIVFVAVWYSAGIGLAAAAGAIAGPLALRW